MDLYISASRWIQFFKEWNPYRFSKVDTQIQFEEDPLANSCTITLHSENQKNCTDHAQFEGIVPRFVFDYVAVLQVGLQIFDFQKWHAKFMTVYSGVVRPFIVSKTFEFHLPKELPRNVIMTTHHRSWNIRDGDSYSMNFIAHLYESFDVIMKQEFNYFGIGAWFTDRFFSGKPMLKSPHWCILKTWLDGIRNEQEEYRSSKQQRCMTIVPDRDSQQIENDTQVGFGLGSQALALAVKVPILDVIALSPLEDNQEFAQNQPHKQKCLLSKVEIRTQILNHALDDPCFAHVKPQDIQNASEDSYNLWRKTQDTEIKEFACIAKKKFLELAHIDNPMCPVVAQKTYPEYIERGRLLTERYGCPVDGPKAVVPSDYSNTYKFLGYF